MSDNTNKGQLLMKIEALKAERDSLTAQLAEARHETKAWEKRCVAETGTLRIVTDERDALAAQVEVLREKLTDIQETTSEKAYVYQLQAKQALRLTPSACLAQVRADVAQEYYYMGWEHSLSTKAEDGDHYACGRRLAKQFADAIRQGGAE